MLWRVECDLVSCAVGELIAWRAELRCLGSVAWAYPGRIRKKLAGGLRLHRLSPAGLVAVLESFRVALEIVMVLNHAALLH